MHGEANIKRDDLWPMNLLDSHNGLTIKEARGRLWVTASTYEGDSETACLKPENAAKLAVALLKHLGVNVVELCDAATSFDLRGRTDAMREVLEASEAILFPSRRSGGEPNE